MGPIALFDKSFIQSLSIDESVWFDRFFLPVVCPIFYVETLADLAKAPKKNRSAESEVRIIASKFPEMSGCPCRSHNDLCVANLLGTEIPMNGRIPRGGGRPVKGGNRLGYVFDQSPEEAAFQRWQAEEFYEVERLFAARYRADLQEVELQEIAKSLRTLGISGQTCKSIEDAKEIARSVVTGADKPFERLGLAARFFNVPPDLHARVIARWESRGRRPLDVYAPYAAFVLTIEIFFQLAVAASLISGARPSNRTDIAYLFYLPFSMVFVSSDRLHERVARLFLRSDQEFVWGLDLKSDLKRLNDHYLALPSTERERGVMRFADHPPAVGDFLVAKLWERHLRSGILKDSDRSNALSPENAKKLVEKLKAFTEGAGLPPGQVIADEDQIEAMAIERQVHRKKGSWWQVPKDLPDSEDS